MGKVRLAIDFVNLADMARFFKSAKMFGVLPDRAAVYTIDALDQRKDTGVTPADTFIVRARGDRPEELRLKEVAVKQSDMTVSLD
jgi:hypothetical protein